jgi:hypothetical protein
MTSAITMVILAIVAFAAGIGLVLLLRQRPVRDPHAARARPLRARAVDAVRTSLVVRLGGQLPTRVDAPVERPGPGQLDLARPVRPELQPAQTLPLPATRKSATEWPPGLTVVAHAAGKPGAEQRGVHYVQPNVVALAQGLGSISAGQRAAALTLSAVLTSPLGRTDNAEEALRDGARAANRLVRSIARRDPQYSDMVTTLDVVYLEAAGGRLKLHFAHVGSSIIWCQRVRAAAVEPLTVSHAIDGGPVLRAVGLGENLAPDVGLVPVAPGDRIFLTTASPYFAFTPALMTATAGACGGRPLHDAVSALAGAVTASGTPEAVTVIAAEVTNQPSAAL